MNQDGDGLPTLEPRLPGFDYLENFPDFYDDNRTIRLALWAQLEQQGLIPVGTVEAAEAAAASTLFTSVPQLVHHDFRLTCDLDADNATDAVSNEYDLVDATSRIFAINGATGRFMWGRTNLQFLTLADATGGLYPGRSGLPLPRAPENFAPHVDLNGDGVCDLLAMGFSWTVYPLVVGAAVVFDIRIHALDGTTGDDIWYRDFQGDLAVVGWDPPQILALQVVGFPTGFLAFNTTAGPRYAFKTTDIFFTYVRDDIVTGQFVYDYRVTDEVHYANAEAPGDDRWTRILPVDRSAGRTNFTWFTGAAPLAGDAEWELVLDQYWIANPRGSQELNDPLTGRPVFRYGRGMTMLTLNGTQGDNLWARLILDEGPARVNLQTEEPFQVLVWTYAHPIPDATGDGVPDIVALWLGAELNEQGTTNGRLRTHVVPLNGVDGAMLWEGDHQFRGWGYVAPLNVGAEPASFLALGTVDIPLGGEVPPSGRFPAKYAQLRALRMSDGTPAWSYEERYHQDNYLPYHLTLLQYQSAIAVRDFDGDGVRDVLTPARYVRPVGLQQGLLSTAQHEYQVLSGATGDVVHSFRAWGSNGLALTCPGSEDSLTVFSGHARRLDVTRLDPATGTQVWRRPLFNDGRPQATTYGSDLILLGPTCAETHAPDNRTFVAANIYRSSQNRGTEVQPVIGYAFANGAMSWLQPPLDPDPGILNFFELLPQPGVGASATQAATANLGPAVFGLIAGAGLGLLRNRGRKRGEDLP